MTEQSEFSKFPKKQLVRITEKLIDEGFDTGNPYSTDYNANYDILLSIGNFFNTPIDELDVEFFAKFIEINDELLSEIFGDEGNKNLIDKLLIPIAKTYQLDYEVWGTCTYIEFLKSNFYSYDKDWVKDSADQLRKDDNWNIWDGTMTKDTIYENFDAHDFQFQSVSEINDKSTITTESLLNQLVIENTSDVVSSLDKQTLIKLREIINLRLKFL